MTEPHPVCPTFTSIVHMGISKGEQACPGSIASAANLNKEYEGEEGLNQQAAVLGGWFLVLKEPHIS